MHHYPHYIKAFKAATAHLTRVERSLYREAIDLYYDLERPWPADDFSGWAHKLQARTEDEKAALESVQREFFPVIDGAFRNERCDKEILKYQTVIAAASAAGRASAEARANKKATTVKRPLPTRSTNQNQNQNHTPPIGGGAAPSAATTTRGTRLPADWEPDDGCAAFLREKRPDLDLATTADLFRDFWHSKPGKDGCKLDWTATWRNWVRSQRALPGGPAGRAASGNWWESRQGLLAKAIELGIPAPADTPQAFLAFKAAVWVAAGDGPWWDHQDTAYGLAVRLRDGNG